MTHAQLLQTSSNPALVAGLSHPAQLRHLLALILRRAQNQQLLSSQAVVNAINAEATAYLNEGRFHDTDSWLYCSLYSAFNISVCVCVCGGGGGGMSAPSAGAAPALRALAREGHASGEQHVGKALARGHQEGRAELLPEGGSEALRLLAVVPAALQ